MAFIRLPGGIRITLEYQCHGQVIVNVFHAQKVDPIVTADLTALVTGIRDWWIDTMAANFSDDISLRRIIAKNIDVDGGEVIEAITSSGYPGDSTSEALPNNAAFVTTWLTRKSGRSYMGRTYWAGIPVVIVHDSLMADANLAAIIADANALRGVVEEAIGGTMVVASFYHNGVARAEGIGTEIIGVTANQAMDSQRRRLPGRGA